MCLIRVTLAFNAVNLEAARRLRRQEAPRGGLEMLLYERHRMFPCESWRWRLPIQPGTMLLVALLAWLGLVQEVRLAHLRGSGRALRQLARRSGRLVLLDDGLDQYRERPRAIDPWGFPAGTTCWLFSDARSDRAAWCDRFDCRELGPLYDPQTPPPLPGDGTPSVAIERCATLIIDAPGVEQLEPWTDRLPHPWLLVPHPVVAKRFWSVSCGPADGVWDGAPEALIVRCRGVLVVGESMTMVAAWRLRTPGCLLLIALPENTDANLRRMIQRWVREDTGVELMNPGR